MDESQKLIKNLLVNATGKADVESSAEMNVTDLPNTFEQIKQRPVSVQPNIREPLSNQEYSEKTKRKFKKNKTDILKDLQKNPEFSSKFDTLNKKIGNSLIVLEEATTPILDREEELEMLRSILNRPYTPVAILLAQAGVGKTSLVEEFVRVQNENQRNGVSEEKYIVFSLELGKMSADGTDKLQVRLEGLMPQLYELEQEAQKIDPQIHFILFIDEVHVVITIFGTGSKVGGDLLKRTLARAPIKVIAATTRKEYDNTIATDEPLARRFKQIEMSEVSPETVAKIARSWWKNLETLPQFQRFAPMPMLSDDVINRVIQANAMYRAEFAEPAKTIDLLEDFASYYSLGDDNKITMDVVNKIFKERYSINMSLDFDYKRVYERVSSVIKGQPFAMESLRKMVQSLAMSLTPLSKKPLATILMTGPSGTGKTETVKQTAAALYPDDENDVFLKIDMADYTLENSEGAFRKRIGMFVRHIPNAVILFDEFEKAADNIRDIFLALLDDGDITFQQVTREGDVETVRVSLKNTIVFATTNAGAKIFDNDAKYNSAKNTDALTTVQLIRSLKNHLLANGWRPEMLNRFKRILPYRGLTEETYVEIAQNKLNHLVNQIYTLQGIKLDVMQPVPWKDKYNPTFDFVANDITLFTVVSKMNASNASLAGARAIDDLLGESGELYDLIVDEIINNPECKEFKLGVTDNAKIYKNGASPLTGGYYVQAI